MDNQDFSASPAPSQPFWQSWKLWALIGLIVLIIVGIFAITRLSSSAPTVSKLSTPVNSWPTYANKQEGFSFNYPTGWTLSESLSGTPKNAVLPTLIYKPGENCTPKISILKYSGVPNVASFDSLGAILYQTVANAGNTYVIIAYTGKKGCALTEESAGNTASALSQAQASFKFK